MNEASKTKNCFGKLEKRIFTGKGIDIGCGTDPIFENVKKFDMEDGDANKITKYINEKFHYVFSAHCLEHMHSPYLALAEWWNLVEDNGFLYIVVPDEDLYEQGQWPLQYNADHKHTFTISKKTSWNTSSINIIELISSLQDAKIIKISIQDDDYDYNLQSKTDQTLGIAMAQIVFVLQKIPGYNGVKYYNLSIEKLHEKIYYLIKNVYLFCKQKINILK